jgi:hypothetical protein
MRLGPGRRRRGLAPIVVEFVIIVITLIVAVVLGGFTFGLFASIVPPAEVAAQVNSCSVTNGSEACQLTLANEGTKNVGTDGHCSLDLGSQTSGQIVKGGIVPASGQLSGVTCIVQGDSVPSGYHIAGSLDLTNGGVVYFAAVTS